jgi:hypothetical protein
MARRRFSPLEEYVLQLLGEQWYTKEELKRKVWPTHSPEVVNLAVAYLKRHELVVQIERGRGEPYLESTQLGIQVLADVRRARTPMHLEGAYAR